VNLRTTRKKEKKKKKGKGETTLGLTRERSFFDHILLFRIVNYVNQMTVFSY